MTAPATQRIIHIRREYNSWVADETLEDYALRYAPRSFRKWSFSRIAHTALGAVSFLAMEAIGGTIALNWGFTNAMWAIGLVALVITRRKNYKQAKADEPRVIHMDNGETVKSYYSK